MVFQSAYHIVATDMEHVNCLSNAFVLIKILGIANDVGIIYNPFFVTLKTRDLELQFFTVQIMYERRQVSSVTTILKNKLNDLRHREC